MKTFFLNPLVLLSRRRTHKELINPMKSTLFIKPWFDLVVAKSLKCKRTKTFVLQYCVNANKEFQIRVLPPGFLKARNVV
jgi:hypothetical protein